MPLNKYLVIFIGFWVKFFSPPRTKSGCLLIDGPAEPLALSDASTRLFCLSVCLLDFAFFFCFLLFLLKRKEKKRRERKERKKTCTIRCQISAIGVQFPAGTKPHPAFSSVSFQSACPFLPTALLSHIPHATCYMHHTPCFMIIMSPSRPSFSNIL